MSDRYFIVEDDDLRKYGSAEGVDVAGFRELIKSGMEGGEYVYIKGEVIRFSPEHFVDADGNPVDVTDA